MKKRINETCNCGAKAVIKTIYSLETGKKVCTSATHCANCLYHELLDTEFTTQNPYQAFVRKAQPVSELSLDEIPF